MILLSLFLPYRSQITSFPLPQHARQLFVFALNALTENCRWYRHGKPHNGSSRMSRVSAFQRCIQAPSKPSQQPNIPSSFCRCNVWKQYLVFFERRDDWIRTYVNVPLPIYLMMHAAELVHNTKDHHIRKYSSIALIESYLFFQKKFDLNFTELNFTSRSDCGKYPPHTPTLEESALDVEWGAFLVKLRTGHDCLKPFSRCCGLISYHRKVA